MKWFADLPTRTKLFLSFGLLILLFGIVLVTAFLALQELQESQRAVVDNYAKTSALSELRADLNRQRSQMLMMTLSDDPKEQDAIHRDITSRVEEIDRGMENVIRLSEKNPDTLRRMAELKRELKAFRDGRQVQAQLIKDKKLDDAKKLGLGEQEARFEKIRLIAVDIGEEAEKESKSLVQESEKQAHRALWLLVLAGLLASVLSVGVVITLNKMIATPLTRFTEIAEHIGQGDLTQQVDLGDTREGESRDEVKRLGLTLNRMTKGLQELTVQIGGISQTLNSASAEIMSSIQEQVTSSRQQAATVQEITTTMTEVSQSGAQIAERTKQVATAAEATSAVSNAGIQAVQNTTRAMTAIREQVEEVAENIVALSEKTQAIGEIVATVNDIAERSNLLALNAAIEAASAGEQGSRFSVVANEMKNLADQAKDSTVQVRTILGDIQRGINSSVMLTEEAVKRVEVGKQQTEVTEQTTRQMTRTTLESIQAFEQILAAGNQQQIGFEQVAQGMKDIRQATEQTAAATAQLEKALGHLNLLGRQLQEAVGRYKV